MLSKVEENVFVCIDKYIRKHGYSPSVRDICRELDRSVSTIHFHLKKLKEKGFIEYEEKVSRTIRIK